MAVVSAKKAGKAKVRETPAFTAEGSINRISGNSNGNSGIFANIDPRLLDLVAEPGDTSVNPPNSSTTESNGTDSSLVNRITEEPSGHPSLTGNMYPVGGDGVSSSSLQIEGGKSSEVNTQHQSSMPALNDNSHGLTNAAGPRSTPKLIDNKRRKGVVSHAPSKSSRNDSNSGASKSRRNKRNSTAGSPSNSTSKKRKITVEELPYSARLSGNNELSYLASLTHRGRVAVGIEVPFIQKGFNYHLNCVKQVAGSLSTTQSADELGLTPDVGCPMIGLTDLRDFTQLYPVPEFGMAQAHYENFFAQLEGFYQDIKARRGN